MDDSPPPFIVFHEPKPKREQVELIYEQALALAGHVHRVIEEVPARHHHKALLDRGITRSLLELARGVSDLRSQHWRYYRAALLELTDCATVLDILHQQNTAPGHEGLAAARSGMRSLVAELLRLTRV